MSENKRTISASDEILLSTELVEESIRSDFWRAATRPIYEVLPLAGVENQRLEGTLRSRQVAGLLVGPVTFNAQRYNRDRRIILWGGLDDYLVAVVTAGTVNGDFAGANVTARLGDICVLDLAQVVQAEVAAGGSLSIYIPRQVLAKAMGHANLHGMVLKAHLPMTRLLTNYLRGLNDHGGQLSDDEAAAVQEALITTLTAALRGKQPHEHGDQPPLSIALRQRILDFIDGHINNPSLNPDLILRRFNVSRAHLYRVLAREGGVSSVIRDRRLDAAFLQLMRTDIPSQSITEVALAFGFSNGNQLLRGFRTRFGLTPSEARRERPPTLLTHKLQTHFLETSRRIPGLASD